MDDFGQDEDTMHKTSNSNFISAKIENENSAKLII